MKKSEKFLLKINSKNQKWQKLRQKEKELAIFSQYPELADKCIELQNDIDFIRKELRN